MEYADAEVSTEDEVGPVMSSYSPNPKMRYHYASAKQALDAKANAVRLTRR